MVEVLEYGAHNWIRGTKLLIHFNRHNIYKHGVDWIINIRYMIRHIILSLLLNSTLLKLDDHIVALKMYVNMNSTFGQR